MILSTALLKKIITSTSAIIDGKSPVDALNCLHIVADNGTLSISATNIDAIITESVAYDGDEQWDFIVKSSELLGAVKGIVEEEVTVTVDGGYVTLKAKRQRFKLAIMPSDTFPAFSMAMNNVKHSIVMPAKDFINAVDCVDFVMSKDDLRPYLRGVLLDVLSADTFALVATNGIGLAYKEVKCEGIVGNPGKVIIPDTIVKLLLKCSRTDDDVSVDITDNLISFAFNGTEIVSKVVDNTYPEYRRIFPRSSSFSVNVDADEIMTGVKSCLSVGDMDKNNTVRIAFTGDRMSMHSSVDNGGETDYDVLFAEIAGERPFDVIGVNGKRLEEGIAKASGSIEIKFGSSAKDTIDILTPTHRYIVMPVRL